MLLDVVAASQEKHSVGFMSATAIQCGQQAAEHTEMLLTGGLSVACVGAETYLPARPVLPAL